MSDVRTIAVTITANNSAVKRQLRSVGSDVKRLGKEVESVGTRMRRAWQNVGFGRVTNRLKQLGTTIGGLAGVYGFASAIRSSMNFEDSLNKLAIQGGKNIDFVRRLRHEILSVSKAHGIAKEEIAEFASGIVEATGDLDGAVAMMEKMGKVSIAFGTNMGQVSELVTQLSGNMKILPKDIDLAMSALRGQELVGTMTFGKMAKQGARVFSVLPGLEKYGVRATGMAGTIAGGGLMQMAARSFGKAQSAEAAGAAEKFLMALGSKSGKIKRELGVQIQGRELRDIFKDIGAAMQSRKKSEKAEKIFGERGIRVAKQLELAYKVGWGNRMGDKASAATIFGVKGDRELIDKSYRQAQKSPAVRFKKAMADMNAAIHQFMLPVLERLVGLMPTVADGLKWFLDNASLLFNLWLAMKASGIFSSIMGMFTEMQKSGGAGGMSGGGGMMGGMGRAMPVIGTGVMFAMAGIKYFYDELSDIQETLHKQRMGHLKRELEETRRKRMEVARKANLSSVRTKLLLGTETDPEKARIGKEFKRLIPNYKKLWKKDYTPEEMGLLTNWQNVTGERVNRQEWTMASGYDINFKKKLRRGGQRGIERELASLKALRSRSEQYIQSKSKKKLTPEEMRVADPNLVILDKTIAAFSKVVAQLIRGEKIQVTSKVNLTLNTPEIRARHRAGGKTGK